MLAIRYCDLLIFQGIGCFFSSGLKTALIPNYLLYRNYYATHPYLWLLLFPDRADQHEPELAGGSCRRDY
jgi:hypothetical protein